MTSLSVAMVSANFHPYAGGAEKQALEVSRALARRGARVTVLTRRLRGQAAEEELDGVRILRLWANGGGTGSSFFFFLSCLAHLLARLSRYGAFHAHLASSPALAAALAGRLSGKPALVKLGGGVGVGEIARTGSLGGRLKLLLFKLLRPTFVAVNADQLGELEASGLRGSATALVPNGVDLEAYRPPRPGEKDKLREALGGQAPVFLSVGRLDVDKGQDRALETFLKAWMAARNEGLQGSFLWAGSGPAEARFQGLIAAAGAEQSVRLLGPRAETAELYRGADAFVLLSLSEGLSNALLEAMASGLPILATKVTGTRDVVEEGVQGRLFDPASPEEARKALLDLRDPARRETWGGRARERAAAAFGLEKTVDALLKLYACQ